MEQKRPLNGRILISSEPEEGNTQLLYFTCSSLARNDERIYMMSDKNGSPNVVVRDLFEGTEQMLTNNTKGILKSYVYFDGTFREGLGKASVCLDCEREIIYFIQDDKICRSSRDGGIVVLNTVPDGRMTAFTHVSSDGKQIGRASCRERV